MSAALTLARPYARAAASLAREQGQLQAWSDQLGLAALLAADPGIRNLLGNPSLDAEAAVGLLAPEAGPTAEFGQFLRVLFDNGRLPLLPEIAQLFEQARAEAEQLRKVRVTSAVALEGAALESLRTALRKRFGSDIEISQQLDPELIGGAIIDAGDVVIDGSVRGKLERLRTALAQ